MSLIYLPLPLKKLSNKHRIISIFAIIVFAISIYIFRPFPNYYPELGDYIIPIFLRFYSLIAVALVIAIIPVLVRKKEKTETNQKGVRINKYFLLAFALIAFLVGLFGIYIGRYILTDLLSVMKKHQLMIYIFIMVLSFMD